MKKAQISMFILVGAVLLIFVIVFLLLLRPLVSTSGETPTTPKGYVDNCLTIAQTCLLHKYGETAGNLEYTTELKTREDIAQIGRSYFSDATIICEEGLNELEGMKITTEEPNPEILFNLKDTTIKTKQKIIVTQSGSTKTFSDFITKTTVRFDPTHRLAEKIKQHKLTTVNSSYVNAHLLEDENIDGNVYEGKRNVVILTDKDSRIEDTAYKFMFVK